MGAFEQSRTTEKIGYKLGYLFSYALFTTILYYILSLLNKLPESWTYVYIVGITLTITIVGILLKKWLK